MYGAESEVVVSLDPSAPLGEVRDLLTIVNRSKDDLNDIEEYVAREQGGDAADPTAPPAAGA